MKHREHLPKIMQKAHAILDRALDGQPVRQRLINAALRVLGEFDAPTRKKLAQL
jgi:hypothetical protein